MDETTAQTIRRVTIEYTTPQLLPSGHISKFFYDCARLTPNDLARLSADATGGLDDNAFDLVVGIAYGGILFASAVAGGKPVAILTHEGKPWGPNVKGKRVLVVDDVVCKGARLRAAIDLLVREGALVVGCVCIVDRSDGSWGSATVPLWSAAQAPI